MQSGSAAQDKERYANARAEWWWSLRSRFESGDIAIPDDEELVSQLADIRYKINSRGQIQIESKEDMKRRGGSSPDRADALMLAFGLSEEERRPPGIPIPLWMLSGCTYGRPDCDNKFYGKTREELGHTGMYRYW